METADILNTSLRILGAIVALIMIWSLFIGPHWRVWANHKQGQADLALARNEQQIQIAQAQSRLDAAELNKKAAVIEAEAVGLQVEAIGRTLTDHPLYLRWQWIKMMEERPESSTIYVPTEANLPILEASRLSRSRQAQIEDEEEQG